MITDLMIHYTSPLWLLSTALELGLLMLFCAPSSGVATTLRDRSRCWRPWQCCGTATTCCTSISPSTSSSTSRLLPGSSHWSGARAAVRPSTLPACFSSARKSGRSSPSTCCLRRSAANAWARAYARHSSWTGVDWASSTISICAHSSATPPTTPSRPPPSCRWARHASHHGARAVLALSLHGAVSFRGPYPLKPAST